MPPEKQTMDLERVFDKLEEISKLLQGLSDRITRVEVQLDGAKDMHSQVKETDKRVQVLENRVTTLETKLAVWATVAAGAGGSLGLALSKLFGGN